MAYFRRPAKEVPMVPTVDAVAAACIAFRTQGNSIVKYDASGHQFTDENGRVCTAPAVISNKTRALAALDQNLITQADRDEATTVIEHIRGQVTMALLAGTKVSDFVKEVAKALEEETVPQFKVGLLVYAPNVYASAKAKEEAAEELAEFQYTSKPMGTVGAKIQFNFTQIEKRYVQQFNCYSAFGKTDDGNLVSFLTQHEELCESGMRVGKIKKVGPDQYHKGATVTCFNYVKAC